MDLHTAEPLVYDHTPFEVKIAIAKLTARDKISAELVQAACE